jgi:hypothetical protein
MTPARRCSWKSLSGFDGSSILANNRPPPQNEPLGAARFTPQNASPRRKTDAPHAFLKLN